MPGRSQPRLLIAIIAIVAAVAVGVTGVWSVVGSVSSWNLKAALSGVELGLQRAAPPMHAGHDQLSAAGVRQVVISSSSGDVAVVTAHTSRLTLAWSVPGDPRQALTIHRRPGVIDLDFRPPENEIMINTDEELRVTMPPDLAVTIGSDSGDTYAQGRYASLAITADSGDVHVSEFRGVLSAQSDSGDIDVRDAHAEGPMNLGASSGDINFAGDPGFDAMVSSDSGDVNMAISPPGRLHLHVEVDSGDVSSSLARLRSNQDQTDYQGVVGKGERGNLDVVASSGDVSLTRWP